MLTGNLIIWWAFNFSWNSHKCFERPKGLYPLAIITISSEIFSCLGSLWTFYNLQTKECAENHQLKNIINSHDRAAPSDLFKISKLIARLCCNLIDGQKIAKSAPKLPDFSHLRALVLVSRAPHFPCGETTLNRSRSQEKKNKNDSEGMCAVVAAVLVTFLALAACTATLRGSN